MTELHVGDRFCAGEARVQTWTEDTRTWPDDAITADPLVRDVTHERGEHEDAEVLWVMNGRVGFRVAVYGPFTLGAKRDVETLTVEEFVGRFPTHLKPTRKGAPRRRCQEDET